MSRHDSDTKACYAGDRTLLDVEVVVAEVVEDVDGAAEWLVL